MILGDDILDGSLIVDGVEYTYTTEFKVSYEITTRIAVKGGGDFTRTLDINTSHNTAIVSDDEYGHNYYHTLGQQTTQQIVQWLVCTSYD